MGESECDAERGTAKISSLSFHKILKIPCALIRYPNECLRTVKARWPAKMAMITNTPYMIQVSQTPVEELNIDGPALDLKIDFFPFFT